jgi:hypothetical protein
MNNVRGEDMNNHDCPGPWGMGAGVNNPSTSLKEQGLDIEKARSTVVWGGGGVV